jgi:hypothetical protein
MKEKETKLFSVTHYPFQILVRIFKKMTNYYCYLFLTLLISSVYCLSLDNERGCAFRNDNTTLPIECSPGQCLPFRVTIFK